MAEWLAYCLTKQPVNCLTSESVGISQPTLAHTIQRFSTLTVVICPRCVGASTPLLSNPMARSNIGLQPTPYSVRCAPASGHDGIHSHGGEAACFWNQVKELRCDF